VVSARASRRGGQRAIRWRTVKKTKSIPEQKIRAVSRSQRSFHLDKIDLHQIAESEDREKTCRAVR